MSVFAVTGKIYVPKWVSLWGVGVVHVSHEDSTRISVAFSAEDERSMRIAGSRA
jgi:hypothetical protein